VISQHNGQLLRTISTKKKGGRSRPFLQTQAA
jgi:hypothetical protein